jgi:hypothetical protein
LDSVLTRSPVDTHPFTQPRSVGRIARERLAIDVDDIDGGHMLAMSNPGALADRLEAYRLEVQGRAGGR